MTNTTRVKRLRCHDIDARVISLSGKTFICVPSTVELPNLNDGPLACHSRRGKSRHPNLISFISLLQCLVALHDSKGVGPGLLRVAMEVMKRTKDRHDVSK